MYLKNNMKVYDRLLLFMFLYFRDIVLYYFVINVNFKGKIWKLLEMKRIREKFREVLC